MYDALKKYFNLCKQNMKEYACEGFGLSPVYLFQSFFNNQNKLKNQPMKHENSFFLNINNEMAPRCMMKKKFYGNIAIL